MRRARIVLLAADGETNAKGRIFFETKTGIINREKKARFTAIQERFKSCDHYASFYARRECVRCSATSSFTAAPELLTKSLS